MLPPLKVQSGCYDLYQHLSLSLSLVNVPKILPALLPSTSQTICRQNVSHTPSVNMCHVHLTPLSSCKVFVLFLPKKLPSNFDISAATKMKLLNFRLNFCHAKLPPPLPPKYGCPHFCHHILPSNLPPTLHCHI